MDIQAEKLDLITWLTQLSDVSLIKELKAMKKEKEEDWWGPLNKDQKEDIEAGLEDLRLGRKKNISQVLAKYK